jgi:hypothetical protein
LLLATFAPKNSKAARKQVVTGVAVLYFNNVSCGAKARNLICKNNL